MTPAAADRPVLGCPLLVLLVLTGCGRFGFAGDSTEGDAAITDASDGATRDGDLAVECGTARLVADDFDDGAVGAQWSTFADASLTPVETAGALEISLAGSHASDQYAGYESLLEDPFLDTCTVAELVTPPSVPGAYAYLRIGTPGTKVLISIEQTTILAIVDNGNGGAQIEGMVAYDPTNHRYIRMSEQAGTWTWGLSGDGVSFVAIATAAATLPSASTVELGAATVTDVMAGGSVKWGAVVAAR